MAITSQLRSPSTPVETTIVRWQAASLLKPSAVKPVFATVEQTLLLKQLGTLQPEDQATLRQAIASVLG
jgi:mRNA interferase MazF